MRNGSLGSNQGTITLSVFRVVAGSIMSHRPGLLLPEFGIGWSCCPRGPKRRVQGLGRSPALVDTAPRGMAGEANALRTAQQDGEPPYHGWKASMEATEVRRAAGRLIYGRMRKGAL